VIDFFFIFSSHWREAYIMAIKSWEIKSKREILKAIMKPVQFCRRGQGGCQKNVSLLLPYSQDLPTTTKLYLS
jgi:hypothetical protein